MNRMIVVAVLLAACCAHPAHAEAKPPPAPDLSQLLMSLGPPAPAVGKACTGVVSLRVGIDEEASNQFVADLAECTGKVTVVEIDSGGGELGAALEIMKAIERHPRPVICVVDGMAASAAFDILQSCDVRTMTPRSKLMQHTASTGVRGNSTEIQNTLDRLRVTDKGRALHCSKRMGMPLEEYEKQVADGREWWLDLGEALKVHAVDDTMSSVAEAQKIAARMEAMTDGGTP